MRKYLLIRPDTNEEVVINESDWEWKWEVEYNNNIIRRQYEEDQSIRNSKGLEGRFNWFKDIDQSNLKRFSMYKGNTKYSLIFDPNTMKLIHFKRIANLRVLTPDHHKLEFYFFGFEKNINGKTYLHLNIIDPNGNLTTTDDKNLRLF